MRMLWKQRNIWCIAARCLRSNENKPEWEQPSLYRLLRTSTLRHIPPLANSPPKSPCWFYWCLSDIDVRIPGIKCEWPSRSNLLIYKCEEKMEDICENSYGVFQMPRTSCKCEKSPSFLAAFHEGTPPFGRPHSEFWEYTKLNEADRTTRQQKWLRPWRDIISLCLYHVVNFNAMF